MSSPGNIGMTQLVSALREAASQQPDRIKQAEQLLSSWENIPLFYASLQEVFGNLSLETEVRWVAIIYLKNGIDRYWRKSAPNALSVQEKQLIKSRLFLNLTELPQPLALQNAMVVSKIARFDFPLDWPDLLFQLLGMLETCTSNLLALHRILHLLHVVVKALCSKTLAASRKSFQQVSPELFQHVASSYMQQAQQWQQALEQQNIHGVVEKMGVSLMALKCLRRLLAHGLSDFSEHETPRTFFLISTTHLGQYVQFRNLWKRLETGQEITQQLDAHIKLIGKLYLDAQRYQALAFALCPGMSKVLETYWQIVLSESEHHLSAESGERLEFNEKPVVQGLLLFRSTVKNIHYTVHPTTGEGIVERTTRARKIIDSLLTQDFIRHMAEILITRYFLLKQSDFEQWQDDPEAWVNEEEADQWEYQVRPCAEKLWMDLLSEHKSCLAPLMPNMLQSVIASGSSLVKEAVYHALGLGAHDLYENLDFDSLLQQQLLVALPNEPLYIQRRIVLLIGQWVSVKISKLVRPQLYHTLLPLLHSSHSLILRLAACSTMKSCIDDWDFEPESFAPFIEACLQGMVSLLQGVRQMESRMRVLNAISLLVERMDNLMRPFLHHIMTFVPELWRVSQESDEPLLQGAILVLTCKLVKALGSEAVKLNEFLLPLIKAGVNIESSAHVYLMEDALELWQALIQQAEEPTRDLLSLFPCAVVLLDYGSESLMATLHVLESYIILEPQLLQKEQGKAMFVPFSNLLLNMNTRAATAVLKVLDWIFLTQNARSYADALLSSGLLRLILDSVIQPQEPSAFMVAHYLTTLARLVAQDIKLFYQLLQQLHPWDLDDWITRFLQLWCERFDQLGLSPQRALNATALTLLFGEWATESRVGICQLMPLLVGVWTDVLHDPVKDDEEEDQSWEEPYEVTPGSAEFKRRKKWRSMWDLHKKSRLVGLVQQAISTQHCMMALQQVDPIITAPLQRLLQQ